jgi:predicted nucleic acid-binding protein
MDTNIYLDADEHAHFASQLEQFLARIDREVALSSVVVAELLLGVTAGRTRDAALEPAYSTTTVGRVLTPAHDDWERAADTLRALGGESATSRRSFWNDLLLATSCYSAGATLITSTHDDFRRIAKHIPVDVAAPWPS